VHTGLSDPLTVGRAVAAGPDMSLNLAPRDCRFDRRTLVQLSGPVCSFHRRGSGGRVLRAMEPREEPRQ
jgi:hypothetical protein